MTVVTPGLLTYKIRLAIASFDLEVERIVSVFIMILAGSLADNITSNLFSISFLMNYTRSISIIVTEDPR